MFFSSPALAVLDSNSTSHSSIYRGFGQAHTQYSKSTLRVTMLPVFLLVAPLTSVEGLSKGRCLGYDVLCTTADYEFRRYKESVWVGIHAREFPVAVAGVVPLHLYFRLENSEGMKIQLTGQALVSLSGFRVLAIYLMLPEELWDDPPTPTNPRSGDMVRFHWRIRLPGSVRPTRTLWILRLLPVKCYFPHVLHC
ncbi:uncharacterized protein [Hemitrygon akajei]|uniref:uncharacterized protein isoform X3 n=1 Tax=Hemitrygon akajei TaxID=2704970 RepID=UPI003BF97EF7